MNDHYYAVIMAGGGGTRLWPLSRKSTPKQMLRLFDHRSLFLTAVDRLKGVFPPERIYIVTIQEQAKMLRAECPQIPQNNFIIEPMPRGTASVVGLAAVVLQKIDPRGVMAVLTADHYIKDEIHFRNLLLTAYDVATDGYLVTLGVEPTFPSIGFGYIQRGEEIGTYDNQPAYQVLQFKEKPREEQAQEMFASKDHYWNSGMFFWRVERVLSEFERQMPDLYHNLIEIQNVLDTSKQEHMIQHLWPQIQSETIDYGIMEGAGRVAVVPAAGLGWSDVGSWDSLFDLLEGDPQGNIVMGKRYIGIDTSDSLIHISDNHRLVVTIGVKDLVVVDTGDVLLVCDRDQAQMIKQIVGLLKEEGQDYI